MFRRLISVCAAANDITLYTDGTGDHRTNGLSFNPSPAGFVGTDFDPAFGPFIGNITGVIIYVMLYHLYPPVTPSTTIDQAAAVAAPEEPISR
jgi:hypothetical protein